MVASGNNILLHVFYGFDCFLMASWSPEYIINMIFLSACLSCWCYSLMLAIKWHLEIEKAQDKREREVKMKWWPRDTLRSVEGEDVGRPFIERPNGWCVASIGIMWLHWMSHVYCCLRDGLIMRGKWISVCNWNWLMLSVNIKCRTVPFLKDGTRKSANRTLTLLSNLHFSESITIFFTNSSVVDYYERGLKFN